MPIALSNQCSAKSGAVEAVGWSQVWRVISPGREAVHVNSLSGRAFGAALGDPAREKTRFGEALAPAAPRCMEACSRKLMRVVEQLGAPVWRRDLLDRWHCKVAGRD